jgi:hypothetical protein
MRAIEIDLTTRLAVTFRIDRRVVGRSARHATGNQRLALLGRRPQARRSLERRLQSMSLRRQWRHHLRALRLRRPMNARAALLVVLAVSCSAVSSSCSRELPNEAIPGVRLGMTPRDVRDRFAEGARGAWQTKVGGGAGASDDTVLEWTAGNDQSRTAYARFEFHLGMLVALRAHLREPASTERVDLTAKTVTLHTPGQGGTGGTDVTILARDCPTHREEAEALALKGGAKRATAQ